MPRYRSPQIKDLRRQLLFTPEPVRRQQVARLEALIPEIDPGRTYPYEYVSFRITRFRPDTAPHEIIPGEALLTDLKRLLYDLSGTVDARVTEEEEPILSLAEIGKQFQVSVRTLHRWRQDGLLSRKFVFPDGKRRVGVRLSTLDRFMSRNRARVRRSAAFSRISPREHDQIVEAARRLRHEEGLKFSAITERMAHLTGRSRETIRYTLRAYDHEHPESGIFTRDGRRLTREERAAVFRRFENGARVCDLCREFGKTRSAIYAVIKQMRLLKVLATPIRYIMAAEFEAPDAAEEILGADGFDVRSSIPLAMDVQAPACTPAYLEPLYRIPLLNRAQERDLFRRYNYVKYRLAGLQGELQAKGYRARLAAAFEQMRQASSLLRDALVRCNLRLVVSIGKRHAGHLVPLPDLMSEGNMVLMRAVEGFDYTRGTRFATYATWALMKHYARTVPEENYRLSSFVTGQQELLDSARGAEPADLGEEEAHAYLRHTLERGMMGLSERERAIIHSRFGFGGQDKAQTLEEIGRMLGVTRERIRQIEGRALEKLRDLLGPDTLEAFG